MDLGKEGNPYAYIYLISGLMLKHDTKKHADNFSRQTPKFSRSAVLTDQTKLFTNRGATMYYENYRRRMRVKEVRDTLQDSHVLFASEERRGTAAASAAARCLRWRRKRFGDAADLLLLFCSPSNLYSHVNLARIQSHSARIRRLPRGDGLPRIEAPIKRLPL